MSFCPVFRRNPFTSACCTCFCNSFSACFSYLASCLPDCCGSADKKKEEQEEQNSCSLSCVGKYTLTYVVAGIAGVKGYVGAQGFFENVFKTNRITSIVMGGFSGLAAWLFYIKNIEDAIKFIKSFFAHISSGVDRDVVADINIILLSILYGIANAQMVTRQFDDWEQGYLDLMLWGLIGANTAVGFANISKFFKVGKKLIRRDPRSEVAELVSKWEEMLETKPESPESKEGSEAEVDLHTRISQLHQRTLEAVQKEADASSLVHACTAEIRPLTPLPNSMYFLFRLVMSVSPCFVNMLSIHDFIGERGLLNTGILAHGSEWFLWTLGGLGSAGATTLNFHTAVKLVSYFFPYFSVRVGQRNLFRELFGYDFKEYLASGIGIFISALSALANVYYNRDIESTFGSGLMWDAYITTAIIVFFFRYFPSQEKIDYGLSYLIKLGPILRQRCGFGAEHIPLLSVSANPSSLTRRQWEEILRIYVELTANLNPDFCARQSDRHKGDYKDLNEALENLHAQWPSSEDIESKLQPSEPGCLATSLEKGGHFCFDFAYRYPMVFFGLLPLGIGELSLFLSPRPEALTIFGGQGTPAGDFFANDSVLGNTLWSAFFYLSQRIHLWSSVCGGVPDDTPTSNYYLIVAWSILALQIAYYSLRRLKNDERVRICRCHLNRLLRDNRGDMDWMRIINWLGNFSATCGFTWLVLNVRGVLQEELGPNELLPGLGPDSRYNPVNVTDCPLLVPLSKEDFGCMPYMLQHGSFALQNGLDDLEVLGPLLFTALSIGATQAAQAGVRFFNRDQGSSLGISVDKDIMVPEI